MVHSGHLSRPCPPTLLEHPQPIPWGAEGETEETSMLSNHCLAIVETLVCYQRCLVTNPKHSTVWAAVKLAPSQPDPDNIFLLVACG